jgi:hypothetical protein
MNTNEMMKVIATNPAAVEMADRMLSRPDRELSFGEVVALVYDRFFGASNIE